VCVDVVAFYLGKLFSGFVQFVQVVERVAFSFDRESTFLLSTGTGNWVVAEDTPGFD